MLEDEHVEAESSRSDESNNTDLEDGHLSDNQWFGGGPGAFSDGRMVVEEDDLD